MATGKKTARRGRGWRTIDRKLAEYRALRGSLKELTNPRASEATGPEPRDAWRRINDLSGRLWKERRELVRALNERLRTTGEGGRVFVTQGVSAAAQARGDLLFLERLLKAVAAVDGFTPGDDPYGEHDFGSLEIEGVRVLWKIDYYNPELAGGSEDPADPAKTARVLTVMLAEEY